MSRSRRVRRQRPRWLVPAAIAIGAILAVVVGAFVALALTGTRDVAQGERSSTPTVDATPSATVPASAEASVAPSATPEAPPEGPPIIPNLAIAAITVDALGVWAEPNEGSIQYGELGAGARLFIIGEPTEDADQRWYRIAFVDGPTVSGIRARSVPTQLRAISRIRGHPSGWRGCVAGGGRRPVSLLTADDRSARADAVARAVALLQKLRRHGHGHARRLQASRGAADPPSRLHGLPTRRRGRPATAPSPFTSRPHSTANCRSRCLRFAWSGTSRTKPHRPVASTTRESPTRPRPRSGCSNAGSASSSPSSRCSRRPELRPRRRARTVGD